MEKLDNRTYRFALQIVQLVSTLPHTTAGDILGRQVLRSGTAVGANVEEAFGSSTRREFSYKLTMALKEAKETHYWLRLIKDSCLVTSERIEILIQEALELKRILGKSIVTSKKPTSLSK